MKLMDEIKLRAYGTPGHSGRKPEGGQKDIPGMHDLLKGMGFKHGSTAYSNEQPTKIYTHPAGATARLGPDGSFHISYPAGGRDEKGFGLADLQKFGPLKS